MKIAIDIGHNCSYDTGACGIRREDDLTREVGNLVIDKLKSLGNTVINCNPSSATSTLNSLNYRTNNANINHADLYVSIHFNAGGGRGTEVFTWKGEALEVAKNILNNICALGYVNRGIKDGSGLYVVKNTNMAAILIECSFVDSREDMERYNAEDIANAIVKGITGQTMKKEEVKVMPKMPKYPETIPDGVYQIPNTKFYIEPRTDGDMSIHLDRGNYITIRKGKPPVAYWNDNNGNGNSKEL